MKTIIHPAKAPVPTGGTRAGMNDAATPKAWVLYDADCPICTRSAKRFENLLARRGFAILPLQTPWVRERFSELDDATYLVEMRLLFPDGKKFGGADALIELARHYWWAWPLFALGHIPPFRALMRAGYRWFARNRTCNANVCTLKQTNPLDFLPLIILPIIVALFRTAFAPWVFMWTLAFAIFLGCKWLTYRRAVTHTTKTWRKFAYLFAWPGMKAATFLDEKIIPPAPRPTEWLAALTNVLVGATLLFGATRLTFPAHPLATGWIGLAGIVFVLHFGWFNFLSLVWRKAGADAPPLMDNPLASTSLAEFWSRRWNTAFNALAFQFTFRPLRRRANLLVATLAVFLLSGLVHDFVISFPARGGYGLPTLYFLIQGLGMIVERRLGLGRGVRGWFFTAVATIAPATLLFHPPFIKTVILPMLHAIGAT